MFEILASKNVVALADKNTMVFFSQHLQGDIFYRQE